MLPLSTPERYSGTSKKGDHAVSRFGLAVRRWAVKQRDFGSNLLRLSFLFKSSGLVAINETLKWLVAAHLNAGVVLVVTV